MTIRAADIQKAANQTVTNIRDYLKPAAKEAYATGNKTARNLQSAYPAFADNVSDAASRAFRQGRETLKVAGGQVAHTAGALGHKMQSAESRLLKVGFIYMAYRLFISDPHVAQATRKAREHINQQPVESAIIALGVGYVIGKMVRW